MMFLKDTLLIFLWIAAWKSLTAKANECSKMTNFPALSEIKTSTSTTVFVPGTQYLFPDIKFNCDTFITKWMYKGTLRENNSQQYPIFQLWDNELNIIFIRDEDTDYDEIGQYNQIEDGIVEFVLTTPLEVDNDCFFGVYIPENSTPIYIESGMPGFTHISLECDSQKTAVFIIEDIDIADTLVPLVTAELYTTTIIEKQMLPQTSTFDSQPRTTTELRIAPTPMERIFTPLSKAINIETMQTTRVTSTTTLYQNTSTTSLYRNTSTTINQDKYSIVTSSTSTVKNSSVSNKETIIVALNPLNNPVNNNEKLTYHLSIPQGILIAISGIGFLTLLSIMFTVSTCVIIKVIKKRPKTTQNCNTAVNNEYLRDSLIFNQAYFEAKILDDHYNRLVRSATTNELQPDNLIPVGKSNTASMPDIRFNQSIPLPAVPHSLPLPPPSILQDDSILLARSKTFSQLYQTSHVYDLPNVTSAVHFKVPQQYEQPV